MENLHAPGRAVEVSDLMFDGMHYELVGDGHNTHTGYWHALWRSIGPVS